MIDYLKSFGPLRNMLHGLAVAYLIILPFSEPARVLKGWDLFFGGIIPATAPLVFIVIMFDVMMCQIVKGDADAARLLVLGRIIRVHLVLAALVLSFWLFSFKDVLLLG